MRIFLQQMTAGLCLCLSASTLFAAPKIALREGMSAKEIIEVWGAPASRVDRETKREHILEYPQARLLFRDEKLVRWKVRDASAIVTKEKESTVVVPAITDAGERSAVESILTEIISESKNEESLPLKKP